MISWYVLSKLSSFEFLLDSDSWKEIILCAHHLMSEILYFSFTFLPPSTKIMKTTCWRTALVSCFTSSAHLFGKKHSSPSFVITELRAELCAEILICLMDPSELKRNAVVHHHRDSLASCSFDFKSKWESVNTENLHYGDVKPVPKLPISTDSCLRKFQFFDVLNLLGRFSLFVSQRCLINISSEERKASRM